MLLKIDVILAATRVTLSTENKGTSKLIYLPVKFIVPPTFFSWGFTVFKAIILYHKGNFRNKFLLYLMAQYVTLTPKVQYFIKGNFVNVISV